MRKFNSISNGLQPGVRQNRMLVRQSTDVIPGQAMSPVAPLTTRDAVVAPRQTIIPPSTKSDDDMDGFAVMRAVNQRNIDHKSTIILNDDMSVSDNNTADNYFGKHSALGKNYLNIGEQQLSSPVN